MARGVPDFRFWGQSGESFAAAILRPAAARRREARWQVRGELPNRNKFYGLPEQLYGIKLVVEATRKVTSKKGASSVTRSQVMPKTTPFLCSRPGGLVGVADAPNFSTLVLFAQEEMTTETLRDNNNRRTTGRVVENVGANTKSYSLAATWRCRWIA